MKKKILFGAGMSALKTLQELGEDNVECFVDNRPSNALLDLKNSNKKILNFDEYLEIANEFHTIITTAHIAEVIKQLDENGITDYSIAERAYLSADVPFSDKIRHTNWPLYLKELCDFDEKEILEVGSRVVTGANYSGLFERARYTGFDFYEGKNVDVVGDAHKLSAYFDKKFDLIFSSAVFEHLAMPWIAAAEMIKLLKPGGYIFVETHYAYSSHERPWHFFQFSEEALKVLFPEVAGIQCLEAGVTNPIVGRYSNYADDYLRGQPISGLYCHSEFLGRKREEIKNFSYANHVLQDIVVGTKYPKAKDRNGIR